MIKSPFQSIEQIYQSGQYDFKHVFNSLNTLNKILAENLPDNLASCCHVGAIDKSTVVIFVTNQQALHILNGYSNKLLQVFYNANFSFENLLLKTRISKNNSKISTKPNDDDIIL